MKKRILVAVGLALLGFFVLLLMPLVASAATNSEVIDILNAGIAGLVDLVRLAYCATGYITVAC